VKETSETSGGSEETARGVEEIGEEGPTDTMEETRGKEDATEHEERKKQQVQWTKQEEKKVRV
jgi:hypothetical protein